MIKAERCNIEYFSNALELELYECAEVGFLRRDRNTHSFNRLFLVLESGREFSWLTDATTGKRLSMRAGHLYFISRGTDLEFYFHPETHFLSFHFNLRLFHYYEVFRNHEVFCEREGDSGRIQELRQLISRRRPSLEVICRVKAMLLDLIAAFLPEDDVPAMQMNLKKYLPLLEFIHRDADAKTGIAELAEFAGMSRDTLSRNFSRDFGIPLKRYLIEILVAQSEKLLRDPELRLRDIARRLRFNDEYYFSNFFKRETGTSPSEYRRNYFVSGAGERTLPARREV